MNTRYGYRSKARPRVPFVPLHVEGKAEDVVDLIVTLTENDYMTGENLSLASA